MLKKVFLLIIILVFGCSKEQKQSTEVKEKSLLNIMSGTFTNEEQARKDSAFFNVTIHMVPIWENSSEDWMYVEEAQTGNETKPYRQRVYKIEVIDSLTSVVNSYLIDNSKNYINAWKTPHVFDEIGSENIRRKEGCGVYLKKVGVSTYKGGTRLKDCPSTLWGASYATSKVEIGEGYIHTLDRGFNSKDEQVWGSVNGSYLFKKVKQLY